ncbi:tripartite motif-containing protein 2-like [Haliotis cracherodii]|uniref:tripartite motif-containing protein 2-like n=1 Tax=Haliotis cracherodii TaxID=6455 RepID=UPI0039EC5464
MTPEGNVAVTQRRQRCVTVWTTDGHCLGEFGQDLLQCPTGLGVDRSGRLYVSDEEENDVYVFHQTGRISHRFSDTMKTTLCQPRYVWCSRSDRVLVSDSGNHCVKVFNTHGKLLFHFGSYGNKDGQFKFPYGVCADQDDNIIVADHYNDRVVLFSPCGEFLQNLVTSAKGLNRPCGVAVRSSHTRKLHITHGDLMSLEVVVFNMVPLEYHIQVDMEQNV